MRRVRLKMESFQLSKTFSSWTDTVTCIKESREKARKVFGVMRWQDKAIKWDQWRDWSKAKKAKTRAKNDLKKEVYTKVLKSTMMDLKMGFMLHKIIKRKYKL